MWRRPLAMVLLWLLCAVAAMLGLLWMLCAIAGRSERAHRIGIAFDQVASASTGGSEDMTISTRAADAAAEGRAWGRALCWLLDQLDPGHCERCRRERP